ncbi:MAG TPA: bacitracin ABC transporter permease [Firmicutes bacterium]|jgi:ABC-2 type transport system permease protein|nr:bacitracin ABC transporter permease [Bacillota bacterium]
MKNMLAAIWSESLKVLRSQVFWLTFIFIAIMPIMFGLMGFIQKNPELAYSIGSMGSGVTLNGIVDWTSYLGKLYQSVAGGGMIGFAFVASWIFGREYTDRTIKDLLALPISRSWIVLSKFIVMFIWYILLSLFMFLIGLIVGRVINLDGLSVEILMPGFYRFSVTAIITMIISTPAAFLANYSRGYSVPIGFAILTVIHFIGLVGLMPYYPWTFPGLYQHAGHLITASWIILGFTGVLGLLGTFSWWRYSAQT